VLDEVTYVIDLDSRTLFSKALTSESIFYSDFGEVLSTKFYSNFSINFYSSFLTNFYYSVLA